MKFLFVLFASPFLMREGRPPRKGDFRKLFLIFRVYNRKLYLLPVIFIFADVIVVGNCIIDLFCWIAIEIIIFIPPASLWNRIPLCLSASIFNARKAVAVIERKRTNRGYAISYRYARKAGAGRERIRTNRGYAVTYRYACKASAGMERPITNRGSAIGDYYTCYFVIAVESIIVYFILLTVIVAR